MTDDKHSSPDMPSGGRPDRELNIKAVVGVGIALALATALGALASWWLSVALRDDLERQDPAPPVLLEAQIPYEPPGPNLQTDPEAELLVMRTEEAVILESYAWSDAGHTAARVPIERAMRLLLETRPGAEAFAPAVRDEVTDDG